MGNLRELSRADRDELGQSLRSWGYRGKAFWCRKTPTPVELRATGGVKRDTEQRAHPRRRA